MDYLLPALAFMTFAVAILFARWSEARTERALHSRGGHSSLAQDRQDPRFLPDAEVTDPRHVNH